MNMNERIRYLRKEELKMTQNDFASKIDISRSNLGNIETGEVAVTDRVISAVCREFNVNESWIRAGNGDIFNPVDRDIQIETFIGNVLRDESGNFKRRLISALCSLSEDEWEFLERKLREIVGTDENGTG